jgi:1,4-alpha-glucan branching enzyme
MERTDMKNKDKQHEKRANGAQAGPKVVEVTFALESVEAKEVYLSGDFNHWSPTAEPMTRRGEADRWVRRLALPPGRYEYKFVVDGKWTPDPDAGQDVVNTFGSINSVLEVRL